jgi:hypothetical protein
MERRYLNLCPRTPAKFFKTISQGLPKRLVSLIFKALQFFDELSE